MKKLSLVIPCYNEARNLPALVARCREVFSRADVEVVLVDNGSTDETPSILPGLLAAQSIIRSVRVDKNQGYGYGILQGLAASSGEYIGWTHADMQTDPQDALRALALIEETPGPARFVKGRRFGRPFSDVLFTVGMSVFESIYLRSRLWDINAQPTVFPRTFFLSWKTPPADFSLDLYAYYQARHQGLPVRRFPVHFGKRLHGESHWNINWRAKWKFIVRTIDFTLRLRRQLQASEAAS